MHTQTTYPRTTTLITALSYLLMFFAAIFANFVVIEGLINPDDAAQTITNITTDLFSYRLGLIAFIIILLCDLLVSWGLYILLKHVNQPLSLLAAWTRLVYTAIFAIAIFNLFDILTLVTNPLHINLLTPNQRGSQILLAHDAFHYSWLAALIFFALHLALLGRLVYQSPYFPKLIGILLTISATTYLLDSLAQFLLTNYADYADLMLMLVALPSLLAELGLTLWLLYHTIRPPQDQPLTSTPSPLSSA
ncbi:MAG TPA: DUF4386 domain-containing protein [Anaerolineae bacterium]|nr:DUF4386 domain-containing protein [Anaerolineae bacterium]